MVDNSTQTLPLSQPTSSSATIVNTPLSSNANSTAKSTTPGNGHLPSLCGPNRIQHASTLEPTVPCYALSSIVSTLNSQISLLLVSEQNAWFGNKLIAFFNFQPKINERDMERERLRKENQHLRELLNAMHERQRVEAKLV